MVPVSFHRSINQKGKLRAEGRANIAVKSRNREEALCVDHRNRVPGSPYVANALCTLYEAARACTPRAGFRDLGRSGQLLPAPMLLPLEASGHTAGPVISSARKLKRRKETRASTAEKGRNKRRTSETHDGGNRSAILSATVCQPRARNRASMLQLTTDSPKLRLVAEDSAKEWSFVFVLPGEIQRKRKIYKIFCRRISVRGEVDPCPKMKFVASANEAERVAVESIGGHSVRQSCNARGNHKGSKRRVYFAPRRLVLHKDQQSRSAIVRARC